MNVYILAQYDSAFLEKQVELINKHVVGLNTIYIVSFDEIKRAGTQWVKLPIYGHNHPYKKYERCVEWILYHIIPFLLLREI